MRRLRRLTLEAKISILVSMNKIYVGRLHKGHPWIFSNEITNEKDTLPPAGVVDVFQGRRFMGRGFYNPHSLIAVRRFSHEAQEFDRQFVDAKIMQALDYRAAFVDGNSYRLVYSESDGLPGLIIDRYDANYVIQINCLGMDERRDLVVESLINLNPLSIYEKSDSSMRALEGLQTRKGLLTGQLTSPLQIEIDGLTFLVDIENGQKTGFFLDLSDTRRAVKAFSRNRKVLDLFCYSGAFACYALQGGASDVIGVDLSETAIALARENSRLNGIDRAVFVRDDVFDFLRNDRSTYDLIILDPPSFTRSKKMLHSALRGYKEINIQAMKRLNRDGILVTTSCSHHVSERDFLDVLSKAAADAGVSMTVVHRTTQALDHPILLSMPESLYLKCFFLKRNS